MEILLWSLIVTGAAVACAQMLRWVTKRILKDNIFSIVDEFLAALQCSIGILECGVISGAFGSWSWITIMSVFVFSSVKHFTFIRGKYIGNPVSFIDRYYLAGKAFVDSPVFIFSKISAQVAGALMAHPVSRMFWGKTYCSHHSRALLLECKTSLSVPFMHGFFAEFITTFIAWSVDSVTPVKWKPPIRSAVSLSLFFAFFETSGAWMNPAIASAHTFNCLGHQNLWEHFITYWLGPYLAAIVFYEIREVLIVMRENVSSSPLKQDQHAFASKSLVESNEKHSNYKDETQDSVKSPAVPNSKYHRLAGGSLRQRVSNVGSL
ncbi:aquaporin-12B-like [Rhopilema esculentum]|uniref:aquaporin-12B-like n=1 Tax=Rhopilema esculentum TaxID=499914 RepID=UPI0031D6949F|eukprot:gene14334-5376_t